MSLCPQIDIGQRIGERRVHVGEAVRDPEQVLERDARDRDQLGVGALVVEAHQLAVAGTGARCRCGTSGSGRTRASRCSAQRRRPRARISAISAAAPGSDLDQLAADLVAEHPGRRDATVAVVEACGRRCRRSPQAVTRSSTPSSGQRRDPAPCRPTSFPGRPRSLLASASSRRAQRECRHFGGMLIIPSCPTNLEAAGCSNSEIHLHAHPRRPHAPDARAVYALDRRQRRAARRLQGRRPPAGELAALMDDIRANGHTSHLEVVSETRGGDAGVGAGGGGDRPGLPDRRHR